jgi:S-adenosylmethionine decarboxylase
MRFNHVKMRGEKMIDYSTFGRYVVVDTWGVDFDILNNGALLESLLVEAAENVGATVLSVQTKQFDPQGATILVSLSESHLSIHTYPENRFAALDCYTCGETINPQLAAEYIISVLKPKIIYSKTLIRGVGEMKVVPL